MANPSRPEPMNATTNHPKVKVSLTLGEPYFLAGEYISGKMEMDCKADQGLGINVMMIELFAIQELTSRDHSARSTFIHTRRLFQGPGLPPSNAVQAHPMPGDPPLPPHYHQAKRGHSTFLFRLPLPATSPSSISFGSGLATVKYEVRATVGVSWKGERQLVTDKKDAEVVEAYDEERIGQEEPEATVVGENGKIWCQARVIGGILVAGESACIELQVKNHSVKKNTGLSITLNRSLNLANTPAGEKPLQINDTVITVPFRGSEYIIPPGVEGVASLVFDVPKRTKGVRGGLLLGDESEAKDKRPKTTQGLFEISCIVAVKMTMGLGSKDILLEIPVTVVHPSALPELPPPEQYPTPYYDLQQAYQPPPHMAQSTPTPFLPQSHTSYPPYPALPISPGPGTALPGAYVDPNQNLVWLPAVPFATTAPTPQPYHYHPDQSHQYYNNLQPQYGAEVPGMQGMQMYGTDALPRPLSAGPFSSTAAALLSPALPNLPMSSTNPGPLTSVFDPTGSGEIHALPPLPGSTMHRSPSTVSRYGGIGIATAGVDTDINGEEGTGQRASRIARNLRVTSQAQGRGRSVSPVGGRRYPLTGGGASHPVLAPLDTSFREPPQTLKTPLHSPRPVLSPKQSFTKVTQVSSDGGAMISKSVPKSERVEELERLADEVGSKTKDLSGDWEVPPPPPEENHVEPPLVPTVTDKARFNASKAKAAKILDDYFSSVPLTSQSTPVGASASTGNGNLATPSVGQHRSRADPRVRSRSRSRSRTPPTPATPTLTAVATPRKSHPNANHGYSTKAIKSKTGNGKTSLLGMELGRKDSESGLDALERKLLAEVGTRKIVDEKRPNVWSVLGADSTGSGADARETNGQTPSRRPSQSRSQNLSPVAASSSSGDKVGKPSPISIPRRDSDRDPLNDSAISSLTLPDCGPGDINEYNLRIDMLRMLELDDAERQRDSDEKTHRGGVGKKKSRKSASRGTLKDGDGGDGAGEGKKKDKEKDKEKEKKSKKKGKDRSSATKGRVAAWLGSVEAEPPLDDVIAPSPSPGPEISDLDDPEPKIEPTAKTKTTTTKDIDINPPTAAAGLKSEPSKPELTPAPDPRSSGFVPIGTLKRDIYQRTLVPKDSPLASTSPTEDAKRITDIWNHRDTAKDSSGAPLRGNMPFGETLKNPWQSVVGKSRIPTLPPPSNTDPEVKYDVRSARGGKGGRVTAVAAIWATGAVGATKPVVASPLSSNAGAKPAAKALAKPPLPFSVPRLPIPISTSSSSSSTSGDGRRAASTRPGVKVASAPVPAVISSSHAKPMLSTTASLARPSSSASSGGNKVLPARLPPTISELPPDAKVGGRTSSNIPVKAGQRGLGAGNAANNLRAVTNPGSGTKSSTPSTAGEHLAFGQARLRDLIKKYQGQAS